MKKKGFTLVEILVSLSVFLIVFLGILTTYSFTIKGAQKYEEYLYFEKICLDIDKVYDAEGFDAVKNTIFGGKDENDSYIYIKDLTTKEKTNTTTEEANLYFDANYNLLSDGSDSKYKLTYTYTEFTTADDETSTTSTTTHNLIITIDNTIKNYSIINNLDYGEPIVPATSDGSSESDSESGEQA